MKKSTLFSSAALLLFVVAACGGDDAPPPNNGVNSVRLACEIRTQWQKASEQACIDCLSNSRSPDCGCPEFPEEYVGKCADQGRAFGDERACDFIGGCTSKCAPGDCTCVDGCYNDRPACRPRAAALDGCTTDVCDKYCR